MDKRKHCPTCGSYGFEKSKVYEKQCEFCDGTFGGNPPPPDSQKMSDKYQDAYDDTNPKNQQKITERSGLT